jgi:hypothetical protein
MQIDFSRGQWNADEITYAYSYRFDETPTFVQLDDCIQNKPAPGSVQGYDNISLLTREKYTAGTRISTQCAYDVYGAPLIVIADRLYEDSGGILRYGDYLEIVIYRDGVNVWQMYNQNGKVSWTQLLGVEFPITAHEIHTLAVEIRAKKLIIHADEHRIKLHVKDLYPSFHIGINACEGINRFYTMTVEKIND